MEITNTLNKISDIYANGSFDINKWKAYIRSVYPRLEELCFNDMEETLKTELYAFNKDFLPILNLINNEPNKVDELINNFNVVTIDLEEKIISKFGKSIDVEIILYLGLCNGAGWVVTIDDKTYCLLGIEKILELNWYDIDSLYGLIYHELGHAYQKQYGTLERSFDNNKQQFLWQLFTEGIAMYFEQSLMNDFNYYHNDKNGWKIWCDENLEQIKIDFYNDLETITFENQKYFGDWVYYKEHNDVGYYLGTKFVQYVCTRYQFDDILSFDIDIVERLYKEFLTIDVMLFDKILTKYDITYNKVTNVIDSSKYNDYRLNIILDNKYVLRINNKDAITEERLQEIDRLINRYNEIGIYAPHYIKNNEDAYSLIIKDKIYYVSQYANYQLADELNIEEQQLLSESVAHLGLLANKYTNFDLTKTKSMWSIIDLAPLDIDIDEKQENINILVEQLNKIGEIKLSKKVIEFNNRNREAILNVFDKLPRCVYQGDLNSSNILIKDNHFYGLIDFNMSGTEVNINCFLSETNRCFDEVDLEKYTASELFVEMINYQNKYLKIIFNNYTLNDVEKQVFENYRNIVLISQYPNVCGYVAALKTNNKEKVLELINLIVSR